MPRNSLSCTDVRVFNNLLSTHSLTDLKRQTLRTFISQGRITIADLRYKEEKRKGRFEEIDEKTTREKYTYTLE